MEGLFQIIAFIISMFMLVGFFSIWFHIESVKKETKRQTELLETICSMCATENARQTKLLDAICTNTAIAADFSVRHTQAIDARQSTGSTAALVERAATR